MYSGLSIVDLSGVLLYCPHAYLCSLHLDRILYGCDGGMFEPLLTIGRALIRCGRL